MRRSVLLLVIASLFCNHLFSQTFTLYGDKAFGGMQGDRNVHIFTLDSNYLYLSGLSNSGNTGDKSDTLCQSPAVSWILKVDLSLNKLWDVSFGSSLHPSYLSTFPNASGLVIATATGSDTICGKSEHNRDTTMGTLDYWTFMIDTGGNKIWDKTFGGNGDDQGTQAVKLNSGDYIICGVSASSSIGGDKTTTGIGQHDFWVIKTDSVRHKIWDKVYGGTGEESGCILLTNTDNSFVIAGTTGSPANGTISDTSRGGNDFWVIKIDSAGNRIWDKRYGGNRFDVSAYACKTPDNGYILCGSSTSDSSSDVSAPNHGPTYTNDIWVVKLDSMGIKQWDHRYGGTGNDGGWYIQPAPGGGYWVAGTTSGGAGFDVTDPPYGWNDYWILKIDDNGNKLWDKRFGGPGNDNLKNFIIMPDSSIYLCGEADSGTSAVKTDFGRGSYDYWVVHFKYTDPVFVGGNELATGNWQIVITPNPAKDYCTITSTLKHPNTLTLYDITGRALLQQPFNLKTELDISKLSNGVYIVEVKDKEGRSLKGKVVKE